MNWVTEQICKIQNIFSSMSNSLGPCGESQTSSDDVDLSNHKVSELRDMAKLRGLKGYTALRKAELIDLLNKN